MRNISFVFYVVLSALSHKEHVCKPFFVVGSGRCGSTLLRRILHSSPELHIPPENWKLGEIIQSYPCHHFLLSWEELVHLTVARVEHLGDRWFTETPTDLVHDLLDVDEEKQTLPFLIDRIYRFHGEKSGADFSRWGDKTPMNVRFLNEISALFPDAKFINLVRDGVDVVHSWAQLPDYHDLTSPSHRWKTAIDKADEFQKSYPDKLITVRYENLVSQPEEIARRVFEFIEADYPGAAAFEFEHTEEMQTAKDIEHYQNVFGPITTENIGKGRRNLSRRDKERIDAIIGDLLVSKGYERPI
ncbi:sulfotransferase family protein [Salinibacter ruber]|uniref:sulfotransferase family protein n=1 Tax=Salinibacter ruber TaxID=146919 RepID=UPI0020742B88|nr:sulfotransferase [Salinibacter ruber]